MRRLMEICLTLCEWIQEKRGRASARRAAKYPGKETFLTFLSQGAVGGAIGYFLLVAGVAVLYPNGYSFVYFIVLPAILVFGAVLGSIAAIFVWLPEVLFKRRIGFVTRAVIIAAAVALPGVAFSYLTEPQTMVIPGSWQIGLMGAMYLPLVLVIGSRIRPGPLLIFGAGGRSVGHNFGSLLSIPVGFLLRSASVFCLFEALMTLALWGSALRVDWLGFPAREHLPAIVFAILYFATSAYFSFRSPSKISLLSAAIVLNLPMAAWIGSLRRVATEESNALAYVLLGFMCLWAVYTLCRLIVFESAPRDVDSMRETVEVRKASQCGDDSVQL